VVFVCFLALMFGFGITWVLVFWVCYGRFVLFGFALLFETCSVSLTTVRFDCSFDCDFGFVCFSDLWFCGVIVVFVCFLALMFGFGITWVLVFWVFIEVLAICGILCGLVGLAFGNFVFWCFVLTCALRCFDYFDFGRVWVLPIFRVLLIFLVVLF